MTTIANKKRIKITRVSRKYSPLTLLVCNVQDTSVRPITQPSHWPIEKLSV